MYMVGIMGELEGKLNVLVPAELPEVPSKLDSIPEKSELMIPLELASEKGIGVELESLSPLRKALII